MRSCSRSVSNWCLRIGKKSVAACFRPPSPEETPYGLEGEPARSFANNLSKLPYNFGAAKVRTTWNSKHPLTGLPRTLRGDVAP